MTQNPLLEKLRLLAEDAPDRDGPARIMNADDPINAILDEIDNTLLPAVLRFESDNARLTITASGRMLKEVSEFFGPRPAPADLIGVPLMTENAEQIAEIFEAFCSDCKSLRCISTPVDQPEDSMTNRVSVAVLRRVMGQPDPLDDRPSQERFLDAIGPHIKASLTLEDGVEGAAHGDTLSVSMLRVALKTQLVAFEEKRRSLTGDAPKNTLNLFSSVLDPDGSLCVVKFATTVILFAIPSSATFDVLASFERAAR